MKQQRNTAQEAYNDLLQHAQAKVNPEAAVTLFDEVCKLNQDFEYLVLVRDKRDNDYFIETVPPLIRNFEELIKEIDFVTSKTL